MLVGRSNPPPPAALVHPPEYYNGGGGGGRQGYAPVGDPNTYAGQTTPLIPAAVSGGTGFSDAALVVGSVFMVAILIGISGWALALGVQNGRYNIVQDRNLADFKDEVATDVAQLQATDAANLVTVQNRITVVNTTLVALDQEVDETRANLTTAINGRLRAINGIHGEIPSGNLTITPAFGIELDPSTSPNTLELRNTGVVTINGQGSANPSRNLDLIGECGINVTAGPAASQVQIDACTITDALNNIDAAVSLQSGQIAALNVSDTQQTIQINMLTNTVDLLNAALNGTAIDLNTTLITLITMVQQLSAQQNVTNSIISNLTSSQVVVGTVLDWAGGSVPPGYLACDGSIVTVADYPDLFAAIGCAYCTGGGNCSTGGCTLGSTFAIPDSRGRATVSPGGSAFTARGTVVGVETVTLTTSHMPTHDHAILNSGTHQHDVDLAYAESVQNNGNIDRCIRGQLFDPIASAGSNSDPLLHSTNSFSPTSNACNFNGGDAPTGQRVHYRAATADIFGPANGASPGGNHNHGGATQPQGGNSAHPNIQPTLVLGPKIIRAVAL